MLSRNPRRGNGTDSEPLWSNRHVVVIVQNISAAIWRDTAGCCNAS